MARKSVRICCVSSWRQKEGKNSLVDWADSDSEKFPLALGWIILEEDQPQSLQHRKDRAGLKEAEPGKITNKSNLLWFKAKPICSFVSHKTKKETPFYAGTGRDCHLLSALPCGVFPYREGPRTLHPASLIREREREWERLKNWMEKPTVSFFKI